MPDAFRPEIIVLYCGHTPAAGSYLPEGWVVAEDRRVRFVLVACSSKVEPSYFVKLFENGADGVLMVSCPREQCQFLFGGSGAEQRVKYARRLLDEVGLGGARLSLQCRTGLSPADLTALATQAAEAVRPLGPNPMKKRPVGAV